MEQNNLKISNVLSLAKYGRNLTFDELYLDKTDLNIDNKCNQQLGSIKKEVADICVEEFPEDLGRENSSSCFDSDDAFEGIESESTDGSLLNQTDCRRSLRSSGKILRRKQIKENNNADFSHTNIKTLDIQSPGKVTTEQADSSTQKNKLQITFVHDNLVKAFCTEKFNSYLYQASCDHNKDFGSTIGKINIDKKPNPLKIKSKQICLKCEKIFFSDILYENHMQFHGNTKQKLFKCYFCDQHFDSDCGLINHHWSHVQKASCGIENFVCHRCVIGFDTPAKLVKHFEEHIMKKVYECAFCPEEFDTKDEVLKHVQVHKKTHLKRVLRCSYCDKEFKFKKSYSRHVRRHKKELNINLKKKKETIEETLRDVQKSAESKNEKIKNNIVSSSSSISEDKQITIQLFNSEERAQSENIEAFESLDEVDSFGQEKLNRGSVEFEDTNCGSQDLDVSTEDETIDVCNVEQTCTNGESNNILEKSAEADFNLEEIGNLSGILDASGLEKTLQVDDLEELILLAKFSDTSTSFEVGEINQEFCCDAGNADQILEPNAIEPLNELANFNSGSLNNVNPDDIEGLDGNFNNTLEEIDETTNHAKLDKQNVFSEFDNLRKSPIAAEVNRNPNYCDSGSKCETSPVNEGERHNVAQITVTDESTKNAKQIPIEIMNEDVVQNNLELNENINRNEMGRMNKKSDLGDFEEIKKKEEFTYLTLMMEMPTSDNVRQTKENLKSDIVQGISKDLGLSSLKITNNVQLEQISENETTLDYETNKKDNETRDKNEFHCGIEKKTVKSKLPICQDQNKLAKPNEVKRKKELEVPGTSAIIDEANSNKLENMISSDLFCSNFERNDNTEVNDHENVMEKSQVAYEYKKLAKTKSFTIDNKLLNNENIQDNSDLYRRDGEMLKETAISAKSRKIGKKRNIKAIDDELCVSNSSVTIDSRINIKKVKKNYNEGSENEEHEKIKENGKQMEVKLDVDEPEMETKIGELELIEREIRFHDLTLMQINMEIEKLKGNDNPFDINKIKNEIHYHEEERKKREIEREEIKKRQTYIKVKNISNSTQDLSTTQKIEPKVKHHLIKSRFQELYVPVRVLEPHKTDRIDGEVRMETMLLHYCFYCDKTFVFKGDLRRHIRIHTGEKPYRCKYCPHANSRPDNLKKHVKFRHTKEFIVDYNYN